ncbi:MAG: NTP transferase domain-containing protein [Clostridia bacterium]|nr:NTP transferase domain-containing protein [Clostridia bacterium]
MIGVILAAGDGKRLKDSSNENCCKPLIKIKNKYLITYSLDNLAELKITTAYIVIGKEGNLIKKAIGDEYNGIKLHYVCQQEQKGLTNAFVQALKVIDDNETVILQLSDEIFADLKADEISNMIEAKKADFYCGITTENNPQKIKNNFRVETDSQSHLIKCIEKPETVTDNIKGTGFSIFNGKTQKIIKDNADTLVDLCDCFNYLTDSGFNGLVFTVAEQEFNINTVADLTEAESYLNNII